MIMTDCHMLRKIMEKFISLNKKRWYSYGTDKTISRADGR